MAKQLIMTKRDGQVTWDGDLDYLISMLRNGQYVVTVKRLATKRSIAQNDLLWMWMTCIQSETGTPKEDVYAYYCKRFLQKTVCVGNRMERVYRTSSQLDTVEMTTFLNQIQVDAAQEMGISLPLPEDRFFECFYQQYGDKF